MLQPGEQIFQEHMTSLQLLEVGRPQLCTSIHQSLGKMGALVQHSQHRLHPPLQQDL